MTTDCYCWPLTTAAGSCWLISGCWQPAAFPGSAPVARRWPGSRAEKCGGHFCWQSAPHSKLKSAADSDYCRWQQPASAHGQLLQLQPASAARSYCCGGLAMLLCMPQQPLCRSSQLLVEVGQHPKQVAVGSTLPAGAVNSDLTASSSSQLRHAG